jgi:hypothetical protein
MFFVISTARGQNMWTKEKIDNLLGSQKDFLNSYCNLRTKDVPNTESCRKVIKRIIELMPNTDQQSPLWTGGPNPVVIFGRRTGMQHHQTRKCLGLCVIGNEVFLFSRNIWDDKLYENFWINLPRKLWANHWREKKPNFTSIVLIDSQGKIADELYDDESPLVKALKAFNYCIQLEYNYMYKDEAQQPICYPNSSFMHPIQQNI